MRTLVSLFGGNVTRLVENGVQREGEYASPYAQMYDLLRSFYWSDAYDKLDKNLFPMLRGASVHPIRNPTYRIVEFYARHMWPGLLPDALPIETENDRIVDPIHSMFWVWSNWGTKKQIYARENSLLGDSFLKCATRDDHRRVYMQMIDPGHVVDFEKDERDNLIWIHIEYPIMEGKVRRYHVEIWSKEDQVYRRWLQDTPGTHLDELGVPAEEIPLTAMGIDFVPFVHGKFRDIGDERGVGAVTLAIRKIWEADLIATSLHQRLFRYNKPDVVLEGSGRDEAGRPPPKISDLNESEEVMVGGERFISLPAGWTLRHWIANLDYRSALLILQDHMSEMENDMPELAYYNLREMNQVSGRAVRMLLNDAITSALEARGNAEDALVRINQMALTMMQNLGIVRGIGSYEQGDFEHSFEHRDIFPLTPAEEAEERRTRALADATLVSNLGWSVQQIQRDWEVDEETIIRMATERELAGDDIGRELTRIFSGGGT